MSTVRSVEVDTDGDNFASLRCGDTLVELSKDGDSPACPDSWTWGAWYDGSKLDGSSDETSLATAVSDAVESISHIADDLTVLAVWLESYGVFGKENR